MKRKILWIAMIGLLTCLCVSCKIATDQTPQSSYHGTFWKTVELNEIGIAVNNITGGTTNYGKGNHFLPSILYDFYTFSTNTQTREIALTFKGRDFGSRSSHEGIG